MNRQTLLCVVLMCFGFSLVYAAAQTEPAASPPASAPTPPLPPGKTAPAPLPDPKTPEEFFARARQLSDLEASGIPFHLKATYVASGDAEFTGNGTYEEWWQSKDLWRKEATLGDYKYVEIQYLGKKSVYASSDYIPLRLRQMLDAVLIRIPADTGGSQWRLTQQNLKSLDFAVITDEKKCGAKPSNQLMCDSRDYFTLQGVPRMHIKDSMVDVYNNFELFQGRLVPRAINVGGLQGSILAISVGLLEALSPNENILSKSSIPPEASQLIMLPPLLEIGHGVLPPRVVHAPEPVIPMSERKDSLRKTVVIACTIDVKGAVREPYVQASAGAVLDRSALDAVRQYRFKPAKKDDKPIIVQMRIEVTFHIN